MQQSRRFWLVFLGYVAITLIGLGVPVDPIGTAQTIGPVLLLVGAVGGVAVKRRDPVLSAALSRGFLVAFGLGLLWGLAHLKIVWP